MLDNLTNRLARVMKTLKGEARLTESNIADALREVRMALLEADVALPVIKEFIAAVKEKAVGEEVIVELSVPALPNKVMIRGKVQSWRPALPRLRMPRAAPSRSTLKLAQREIHVAAVDNGPMDKTLMEGGIKATLRF